MKLIFERGAAGRRCTLLPVCDVEPVDMGDDARKAELLLPEVSENDISRHYTELAGEVHGVNNGIYPLGSCTMKYNPKLGELAAAMRGFTDIHPLQPDSTVQGCLKAMDELGKSLCAVTGMDAVTLQPAAGAHGEFTGLLLIKAYHEKRGESGRRKIIVPDSAHGTNPASAVMAGFEVVNIPSMPDGCVDIEVLQNVVGNDTAGLMLTNPNTIGMFDKNILKITEIVHNAGGLNYYDGANLNAIMGIVRPGDMGFDVVHLNLHKTFATPHGGGGPGSGPVGCKEFLKEFLPGVKPEVKDSVYSMGAYESSVGRMKSFYGNFLVTIKALAYITMLGRSGLREASEMAVLNANYLRVKLAKDYHIPYNYTCMHEFVISLEDEKRELGITAMDIAKSLMDYGIHPPTMYFPLIVHEALMLEPTETESMESLELLADAFIGIMERARENADYAKQAPHHALIGRPDEVMAARNPVLKYDKQA